MRPTDEVLKNEQGFTLPEMLVTIMLMVVVLFSLYNLFDASIRVFALGNNKVEAVENARIGLEKMEREIRAAYPVDATNNRKYLFFNANGTISNPPEQTSLVETTQITFGNELGSSGNRKIDCLDANTCEYVTYKLEGATLVRNATASGSTAPSGEPVIESVTDVDGDGKALTFNYLKGDGTPASIQAEVARIRIKLEIRVEGGQQDGTQILITDVELRNQDAAATAGGSTPLDPDPDGDGTQGTDDNCATEAGPSSNLGCPLETDTDGDGIADDEDRCSTEAGDPTNDGCPIKPECSDGLDNDGDKKIDWRGKNKDPDCADANDTSESAAQLDTRITVGPSGTVTSNSATFEFDSPVSDATFECRLDGGPWGSCTSPKTYSGLSSGSHTFEVRAKRGKGNTDDTPASRFWTIAVADTTPPNTTITNGPSGIVNPASASFQFTSTEAGTFECKLDSGGWESCSSPKNYSGLSNGSHTFQVRATDAAGNTDATPASRTWTIANRPPVAANDTVSVRRSQTLTVNAPGVLGNDSDPDGDQITKTSNTAPSRGNLTLNANGSGTYQASSTTGTVTFDYTISDGRGGTTTARVTINVTT